MKTNTTQFQSVSPRHEDYVIYINDKEHFIKKDLLINIIRNSNVELEVVPKTCKTWLEACEKTL